MTSFRRSWDLRRLERLARHCPAGLVADVGFASRPNPYLKGTVIGVDLHPRRPGRNYAAVVAAAAEALPFDERLDAIAAGEIIEHLSDPLAFLVGCNRALKAGGTLVLSTPNPHHATEMAKNVLGSKAGLFEDTHLTLLTYRLLHKLLDLAGFEVVGRWGTYIKVPGLPLGIPAGRLPTLSHNFVFLARKARPVRLGDVRPRLRREYERRGRGETGE